MRCESCGSEYRVVAVHFPGEPAERWHRALLCVCPAPSSPQMPSDGMYMPERQYSTKGNLE